ncbi:hypothetical protein LCGC14_0916020 [marine sediment metagenome]|uniref:Uncharacterized protein n=1 Tax=marine sediment metagenome TaxID=412755 RepID=A0A0F9RAY6_9ZZZZ
MIRKCKWCGSKKHISKACAIKHKHQALLDGVPLARCGFDAIIEIDFGNQGKGSIVTPAYPIAGL